MFDRIKQFADEFAEDHEEDDSLRSHLVPLRAAAAQLLLATGAGATLEHLIGDREEERSPIPEALAWAPALLGPLAAAANLEHARNPSASTRTALKVLAGASVSFGAALYVFDALGTGNRPTPRVAPIAFASAGLLNLILDREEEEIEHDEAVLRRRANVVERLVPARRPKLDRIVLHV